MSWVADGNCSEYMPGTISIKWTLPARHPYCKHCQKFLRYDHIYKRYTCSLTDEILLDISYTRGKSCPLKI